MSQVKHLGLNRGQEQILLRPPSLPVTSMSSASSRRHIHPILKAYSLGLLSHITPRLLALLVAVARRKRRWDSETFNEFIQIFKKSAEPHRFPAFCGITIAGGYVLRPVFERILKLRSGRGSRVSNDTLASFLAFAISAGGGLQMLNSKRRGRAGRTIDLTLFAVVRALDVVVGELWQQRRVSRKQSGKLTTMDRFIGHMTDPALFAVSSALIMFAWFFKPDKLPPSYNKQIYSMANVDERLVIGLRKIRAGEWIYGKDTGQGHIFGSLSQDSGFPYAWGDPARTMPVPCEVIHSGETDSCEIHALRRFIISTGQMAFPIYLTLNMLRFLRPRVPELANVIRAVIGAARSASFLGAFVGLFWYGVCLTRTRIGPLLLEVFPNMTRLDLEKWCVQIGCLLCGWSVMIENPQRRAEFMFFVAPRALATMLPRRYNPKYQWIETATFGLSAGVVFSAVRHNPKRVRGVFGKLLSKVVT